MKYDQGVGDPPRVEATHGMVAFQSSVHDSSITLLGNALLGDLGVNPIGESPHVRTDLSELNRRRSVVADSLLELFVEVAIVEENVGVVIPSVEMSLHGLDGLDNTIDLLVSREDDKGSIGAGLAGIGLKTTGHEDLVVLLTNLSVTKSRQY